jgi:hypothetical protein
VCDSTHDTHTQQHTQHTHTHTHTHTLSHTKYLFAKKTCRENKTRACRACWVLVGGRGVCAVRALLCWAVLCCAALRCEGGLRVLRLVGAVDELGETNATHLRCRFFCFVVAAFRSPRARSSPSPGDCGRTPEAGRAHPTGAGSAPGGQEKGHMCPRKHTRTQGSRANKPETLKVHGHTTHPIRTGASQGFSESRSPSRRVLKPRERAPPWLKCGPRGRVRVIISLRKHK